MHVTHKRSLWSAGKSSFSSLQVICHAVVLCNVHQYRQYGVLLLLSGLLLLPLIALASSTDKKSSEPLRVALLHPGERDDPFWSTTADIMYAAAADLDMSLRIFFTNRNKTLMIKAAKQVLARADKPHYIIISNYQLAAPEILTAAEQANVPVMLIVDGLTNEQNTHLEQKVRDNIVGTVLGNERDAGYIMAKSLLQKSTQLAQFKNLFSYRLIALNTDQETPAARDREVGLFDALEEFPLVVFDKMIYSNHSSRLAEQQVMAQLKEYKGGNFIWAADENALEGAMTALHSYQQQSEDVNTVLVATRGWSEQGLSRIRDGSVTVDLGGDFFLGAWAMVILSDYDRGFDFPVASKQLMLSYPIAMNKSSLVQFDRSFPLRDWSIIDFAAFSKHVSEKDHYDFSLQAVYRQVEKNG